MRGTIRASRSNPYSGSSGKRTRGRSRVRTVARAGRRLIWRPGTAARLVNVERLRESLRISVLSRGSASGSAAALNSRGDIASHGDGSHSMLMEYADFFVRTGDGINSHVKLSPWSSFSGLCLSGCRASACATALQLRKRMGSRVRAHYAVSGSRMIL